MVAIERYQHGIVRPLPQGRERFELRRRRRVARGPEPQKLPVSNAEIAVVMLIVAEIMFFAGLIGAYLLFRYGSVQWPPPNLPRLPLGVTWVNTFVLLASGGTMIAAWRAIRGGNASGLMRWAGITAVLGATFVAIQGFEWARLVHHGLTLSAGTYGASFYALIGAHAAHVVAAVLWLGFVWVGVWRGRYTREQYVGVKICAIYWLFVCVLWVILFGLVYV